MTKLTMNTYGGGPPREAAFAPPARQGIPVWVYAGVGFLFLALFTGLVVTTTLLIVQSSRTEASRIAAATQLDEPSYAAAANEVTRTEVSLLEAEPLKDSPVAPAIVAPQVAAAVVPAPVPSPAPAATTVAVQPRLGAFHQYRVASCADYLDTLVKITTVRFAVGSDDPVATDMIRARTIATAAATCDDVKVIVEGHSDRRGSEQLNMELSWFRAQSVIDQLQEEGFDISVMQPQGFGATRPINLSGTISGEAENRRVQFALASRAASSLVTASGN